MKDYTDQEIVEICREGSGRAIQPYGTLVRRYESTIFKLCYRYFRNEELAEDLTQETFIKAYSQLFRLKEAQKFKYWLFRIASNICADFYRKRKRRNEIDAQLAQPPNSGMQQEHAQGQKFLEERIEGLNQALEILDDSDRSIIVMHYFAEMTIQEIAGDQALSISAVKMRLLRAREKIEKIMDSKGDQKSLGRRLTREVQKG